MIVRPSYVRATCLIGLVLPGLSACALFNNQIEVSRRYDRIETGVLSCPQILAKTGTAGADYCFDAHLSALPLPSPENNVSITSLSDRGQEAYVAGLVALIKDPGELRAAMAGPLKAASAPAAAYQDGSTVKLRFVLSIFPTNGYLNPGDRLAWAKVSITPIGPGGGISRFSSWTFAANAYKVIDVGTVTASRTDKLTAESSLKAVNFLPDAKIGIESSATREEKADIKDQVGIFAAIEDGKAWIVQSGAWRNDLTGNSVFDASVALSPDDTDLVEYTTTGDLKPKKSTTGSAGPAWLPGPAVSIGQRYVRMPRSAPFCAKVSLDFVVRHIVTGDRSYSESNDAVKFLRGRSDALRVVAPPIVAEHWIIVAPRTVRGAPAPRILQFLGDDGQEQRLTFNDKSQALGFLAWLRGAHVTGRVGNGKLFFKEGEPLDLSRYPGLDAIDMDARTNWAAATQTCKLIAEAQR